MRETRRRFLAMLAVWGSALTMGNTSLVAQAKRRGMPNPPPPAEAQGEDSKSHPELQAAQKALRLKNEKEFRDGIERLCQLTGEVRDEVQKTTTTEVFSVRMYKKMEEIEKLAKQLMGKAKSAA